MSIRHLALAVLAAVLAAAVAAADDTIHVYSNGTVEAVIKGVVGPGLNEFPVPAPPIPETITARLDGTSVAVIYEDGAIYIAADKNATAEITYLVNTTEAGGGLEFQIYNKTVNVVIDPGVVLLVLPEGLVDAATTDNGGLLLKIQGPSRIVFLAALQPTQTTSATSTPANTTTTAETVRETTAASSPATAQATTAAQPGTATVATTATSAASTALTTQRTATSTAREEAATTPARTTHAAATEQPQPPQAMVEETGPRQSGGGQGYYLAAAAIVAVAAAAAILAKRRPGAGSAPRPGGAAEGGGASLAPPGLDDTDRLILEVLERHGGTMLQSELQRATGLPKTTLWRHVRRLAEQGYIEIIREGKANRLVLKRTPWKG